MAKWPSAAAGRKIMGIRPARSPSAIRIEESSFKTLISDGRNFGPDRAPLVHGAA